MAAISAHISISLTHSPPSRPYPPMRIHVPFTGSTLNSIRQTDVDTLMIRTQSRVRVRVRVIYLNQTGIRHQILGGVGVRVMHSRWDAPSPNPNHSILKSFE